MSHPMPVRIHTQALTDEALVQCILQREQSHLFSTLMERYRNPLWSLGKQINIPHLEIEDLIQVAFIKVYQKLHTFRGESKFSSWLFRIFINECNMWRRKHRRKMEHELPLNTTIQPPSFDTPETSMLQKEKAESIDGAVSQLPEKYQQVFHLREVEGRKSKEVAQSLGLTDSNVKVRFLRSKLMLQAKLSYWRK